MKKIDIVSSIIIGEICAWLMIAIFKNINFQFFRWWFLPIFLPILSLAGLYVAYFVSKKISIVYQAAKFILIGILNTLVDLGVLNLLIFVSDISTGFVFSSFKGISFIVAVINSYFWNKFWTFKKSNTVQPGKEFLQFLIVSLIGFGINVGVASLIVNLIGSPFQYSGVSEQIWANIGAIIASLVGMTWNFIGYKIFVFK